MEFHQLSRLLQFSAFSSKSSESLDISNAPRKDTKHSTVLMSTKQKSREDYLEEFQGLFFFVKKVDEEILKRTKSDRFVDFFKKRQKKVVFINDPWLPSLTKKHILL